MRGQSSATYTTSQGTYFVFRLGSTSIKAYKITATSPPTIVSAWSVSQSGQGSPWVTTTDGTNNAIVWVVGAQGDGQLHGYNGDTGAVIYSGTDVMTGTRKWNSGIAARGSIYVANDNKVYAFRVPAGTPTPTPTATARSLPLLPRLRQQRQRNSNIYTNCHCDCDGHANCDSDANCYSLRLREPDGNTQTNAHSETPLTPRPRPTPPPRPGAASR